MSAIQYKKLTVADKDEVIAFLASHYLPFETTVRCFNLSVDEIQAFALCYAVVLRQNLSFGAFSGKKICGLVLNSNMDFQLLESEEQYKKTLSKHLKKLLRLDHSMDIFFTLLNEQTFLYLEILAVDQKWAKRGIALELTKRTIQIAIENQLENIITFDTSPKSLHIDMKLGMKLKLKLNMMEYEDAETGEKIFYDCDLPEFWLYVMIMSLKKHSNL